MRERGPWRELAAAAGATPDGPRPDARDVLELEESTGCEVSVERERVYTTVACRTRVQYVE